MSELCGRSTLVVSGWSAAGHAVVAATPCCLAVGAASQRPAKGSADCHSPRGSIPKLRMAVTLQDLTVMSQAGLDDLFRTSPMGEIPDGDATGTAVVAPGTDLELPVLWFARWLAWQGKVFYRPQGYLVNKVGPLGFHLVKARVYVAA